MLSVGDVSIIIPAYCETEESLVWLDECIQSVLSQGCEIIVYDDGSSIDIGSVLSKYYSKILHVKSDLNVGVSYARNTAVQYSTRELIFPLDCDDRLKRNAVRRLVKIWDGIPVYPDICKFGDEDVPHYALLEFDCAHLRNVVGYTSVNVLHSVKQHIEIGKWDEGLDFYEDGEYNARLFGNYCGKRLPEPLVDYRIHSWQRTNVYKSKSRNYAEKILNDVRSYDMACPGCAKKKVAAANNPLSNPRAMGRRSAETMRIDDSVNLPLEFEGKVLARYVGGKGKGKHTYRGMKSNQAHRIKYGDVVYAAHEDTRGGDQGSNESMLVRIEREAAQVPPPPEVVSAPPAVPDTPEPKRSPRKAVERKPVEDLPDISRITVSRARNMDFDPDMAVKLLAIEKRNRNRVKMVQLLEARL